MSSSDVAKLRGLPFAKMTGSGNDFVVFDSREVNGALVTSPEAIRAICNRFNGIGADGVVLLEPKTHDADARIRYFNSDGTAADLCGNATLCSTAIAVELGLGAPSGMKLWTDAGMVESRIADTLPEIDLAAVSDVRDTMPIALAPGERKIGFALAGVPHLVVLVDDIAAVDVARRGAQLRRHPAVGSTGANVNFVAPTGDGTWRYRTFERGVEGETLACGTGSIGTAILLVRWGFTSSPVTIWTSSNRQLVITLRQYASNSVDFLPSLKGEGRVVFRGNIEELGA